MKVNLSLVCLLLLAVLACDGLRKKLPGGSHSERTVATAAGVTRGPKHFPPGLAPVPLKAGQWAKYRINYADGRKSNITYKILSHDTDGFWFEIVQGENSKSTVLQIQLDVKDRSDLDSASVNGARLRMPNGFENELHGATLRSAAPGYKRSLSDVFLTDFTKLPRADITAPVGHFAGCFVRSDAATLGGLKMRTKTYLYPSIPITMIVEREAADGSTKMQLVEYGLTGARTEM